jgi:FMN phosphatase YigB (HAD superfamily)
MAMGCDAEQAEILAPIINRYMSENYQPENCVDPSTPPLLSSLQAAGFTLAVVSNRNQPFDEELVQLGLNDYFNFNVTASEANSWKPDTGIFTFALNKANLMPHEAIYVGDNYFADVVGARNAGLKPVLLDKGGIFSNPDCLAIKTLAELPEILTKT